MAKDAQVDEAKQLICEMCHNFYVQGWVGGTGGGMSIKTDNHIVMAPSGVQKERMVPADMYVLDHKGNVVETPTARPATNKPPKLSECSPMFMAVSVSPTAQFVYSCARAETLKAYAGDFWIAGLRA